MSRDKSGNREKLVCSGCGMDPWTSKAHDGFGRCHGGMFAAGRVAGLREAAELVSELWGQLGGYPQSLWSESLASNDSDAALLLALLEIADDAEAVESIREVADEGER